VFHLLLGHLRLHLRLSRKLTSWNNGAAAGWFPNLAKANSSHEWIFSDQVCIRDANSILIRGRVKRPFGDPCYVFGLRTHSPVADAYNEPSQSWLHLIAGSAPLFELLPGQLQRFVEDRQVFPILRASLDYVSSLLADHRCRPCLICRSVCLISRIVFGFAQTLHRSLPRNSR
jgi:hypothetical protein